MRGIFEPMFEEGSLQVSLHHQIAKDGYVVNHETVTDGMEETECVRSYEVRDGLIKSVRFVRGELPSRGEAPRRILCA